MRLASVYRNCHRRFHKPVNTSVVVGSSSSSSTCNKSKRNFSLAPHGRHELVDCLMDPNSQEFKELWREAGQMTEITLTKRQLCDVELLMNGAFTPLDGFMTKDVYDSVVSDMLLPDGTIWPMPITLDIPTDKLKLIEGTHTKQVVLRDMEYNPIAVMDVEDIWKADKKYEAEAVFGGDPEHPAIEYLNNYTHEHYIGGKLRGFILPPSYDYKELRMTPKQLREKFAKKGWNKIVAFQTRNPMHRAHIELAKRAQNLSPDMNLLIHPVIGQTKPGDIDHHTRVKCYKAVLPKFDPKRTELSVFPLAMRMGGPREAIWHAIIRKNYGCTHFILGRDHAGPGANSKGHDFYGPYDARDAAVRVESQMGIKCLAFEMMLYSPNDDTYYPSDAVPEGRETLKLSGTEVRRRLRTGEDIPEWFSYKDVVDILRIAHPPRRKQGFCVFFTGLSGSGKSTIANALLEKLMELQSRRLTLLDGDHVRTLISSELSFSKEHRNLNIRRIGFIASLVVNSGGIVIACPIAPYRESRRASRDYCKEVGGFCEVWVSTSLDDCIKRDRKGLYKKAQQGLIKGLTGVDDPYEEPEKAEIVIDAGENKTSVDEAVDIIIQHLVKEGYLDPIPQKKENF